MRKQRIPKEMRKSMTCGGMDDTSPHMTISLSYQLRLPIMRVPDLVCGQIVGSPFDEFLLEQCRSMSSLYLYRVRKLSAPRGRGCTCVGEPYPYMFSSHRDCPMFCPSYSHVWPKVLLSTRAKTIDRSWQGKEGAANRIERRRHQRHRSQEYVLDYNALLE